MTAGKFGGTDAFMEKGSRLNTKGKYSMYRELVILIFIKKYSIKLFIYRFTKGCIEV